MKEGTIDLWDRKDGKVKVIITDLLKLHPYTGKGNRSTVSLFDFDGNYRCRIDHIQSDKNLVGDILEALEVDDRFKNFKLAFDKDIKMYEFSINEHGNMPYRSYNTNSVTAVINTTFDALISMRYMPNNGGYAVTKDNEKY
ncbi:MULTISPECIES: hypothetical protein [Bacillus]|uniref:hypothetical protein n=1 Tax=Bacillus TaxID=1386 RepID=UPI0003874070|nr:MULTISPECIES: hypothetical protein [Bacillus]AWD88011.1 hypothetical protein BVQ_11295 [Bacillus velezensis]KAF6690605.1 hypothetical protein G9362_16305 [Bacillus sp. EKM601B]KOS49170.1 hypothetical protein AN272_19710 [Bacillus amyloliquefaciens]MBA9149815.1 hypothetical protein [Bacillus sp. EKM213B]MBU8885928.1 hypothetical protein [Bacillus sp. FJAT-27001]